MAKPIAPINDRGAWQHHMLQVKEPHSEGRGVVEASTGSTTPPKAPRGAWAEVVPLSQMKLALAVFTVSRVRGA